MNTVNEDQIRGRGITDLITIDSEMLETALDIINNAGVKSVELKALLVKMVSTIKDLTNIATELYTYKDAQLVNNIYKAQEAVVYNTKSSFEKIVEEVQTHLSKSLPDVFVGSMFDSDKKDTVSKEINNHIISKGYSVKGYEVAELIEAVQKDILGLSILDKYMDNGENSDFGSFVEEIRVNDFTDIRIVRGGREERTDDRFQSPAALEKLALRIVANSPQEQAFNVENPFIRIRIGDTTRVSIMRDPIARRDSRFTSGPVIHMRIRKQRLTPFTTEFLRKLGTVDEYTDKLLKIFFKNKISVVFYGGTGTGKTGTMTAYINEIPDDNPIITIAEIDEMNAARIDLRRTIIENGREVTNKNFGRSQNSVLMWELADQGKEVVKGRKGFAGLVNAALTMTPETIIMQESKGNEILALLEAAMSDHQVLTTLHAESKEAFFIRLHHMAQGEVTMDPSLLSKQFPIAFPVIVKVSRYVDGTKKISEVAEIQEYITLTDEYRTNTLVQFKVVRTELNEGKKKVVGEHVAYGMPSGLMQERLLNKGMMQNDLSDLKLAYERTKKMDKPDHVDKLYYDEYVRNKN